MNKIIYIVLLVGLLITIVACDDTPDFERKLLSEYTDQELEMMIEIYYEMGRVWTCHKAIIYQNELILRKLE